MQRLRILVILILLSLMPLYSLAVLNEGQYAFRSLDINNGLSQNTVHAILQDKQGFMWFGTKDGLDRYDGISFRTFMKESGTLGNNFITSLYEDNLGQIWIGTDVGLYVYCPQMEKVRHFTLISNSNIDIDCTVNLITGDQKGGIWVVTQTRGIFYYNPQDSQLVNYQSDGSGTLNLKTSGQLYFDSDDVCWLDIRDGNLYYSKDKLKTLTPIFPEDSKVSFRDEYIYKLLPGPYNCMYVGTVFGLKEVNLTNKTIRTLLSKDELGGDIYIRELAFYSDDELWIGTESGLYIYNLHTAKIIHLQNVNGDPYSISDNAIYSILKDREGGMWIGTYFGGVNYYPRQYTYFDKVYPQKESNKMGKRVREFCAAHDGTLWIGTEDKGLFHYYPSTGKIEPFIHPDIYHNVHGLYLDGDYLWVGNFAKGLKRIDLRTYAVKHYDNIASDIFSICRITAGDLYLGTTIGLFRYNPDTERFKRVPELGWTFVYYIKEDKQGNLWLATYADGVYKKNVRTGGWEHFVHEEADSSTLPSNKVLSIFEDSQNQLWFTTQGGGFCRFVPSANTFVRYDGIGLPSNVIYRIEEDEKGLFWVSTNKGLVHFNPKNSSFKVYTVTDSAYIASLTVERNYGFNTAVGNSYQMGTNTIAACISENQIIEQGGRVKLRLLQPLQAGNITVPENSLVTGAAVIQGERLDILISSIEYAGNIIPVQLATYDIDGQKGIFVPGSETRNAAKDAAGTVSESMGNSVSFARSAGQQVVMDLTRGVMQGGTRLIAGRVRAVKVTLKAGYKVLLVTKRQ